MVCCPKESKSKQVPLHVTISRFGNLHILFGIFLIALGICQILFAIQDDIHIAFRVTPIWVGTLVGVNGCIASFFIAKNPSSFRMKFLPFCCITTFITSLGVLAVTIMSLNNLSTLKGVNNEQPENSKTSLNDITKRQIIDYCLIGVSIITSQLSTYLLAASNTAANQSDQSANKKLATIPSSGRFTNDDVTVEKYFAQNRMQLRHKSSVYDDFPDFDHFRNNLEDC